MLFSRRQAGSSQLSVGTLSAGLFTLLLVASTRAYPGADSKPTPPSSPIKASSTPMYLGNAHGVAVFRPAAILKRPWGEPLGTFLAEGLGSSFRDVQKEIKLDSSKPGQIYLETANIAWGTGDFSLQMKPKKDQLSSFWMGLKNPLFRTVTPFDWLEWMHQFGIETIKTQSGEHTYYQLKARQGTPFLNPNNPLITYEKGVVPCLYVIDERTAWFPGEELLKTQLSQAAPRGPEFVSAEEWEKACQGAISIFIDEHGGSMLRELKAADPYSRFVLENLFVGMNRLTLTLHDSDPLGFSILADCGDHDTAVGLARIYEFAARAALAEIEFDFLEKPELDRPGAPERIVQNILKSLKASCGDRTLTVVASEPVELPLADPGVTRTGAESARPNASPTEAGRNPEKARKSVGEPAGKP